MQLRFQDTRIDTEEDGTGLLVFAGDWLLAILSQLGRSHGEREGQWFLEIGFGRFTGDVAPVFPDRSAAEAWFMSSLADRRRDDPWNVQAPAGEVRSRGDL